MSCEISLLKVTFPPLSAQNKGSWLIRVYNSNIQTLWSSHGSTGKDNARITEQKPKHQLTNSGAIFCMWQLDYPSKPA